MTFQAPHAVTDQGKLAAMVAHLEAGNELPPVVVEPNGIRALSGSHRIAAYDAVGRDCPALTLSEEDYVAACEELGVEYLDEWSDYGDIATAIVRTTSDSEIRTALEDQQ